MLIQSLVPLSKKQITAHWESHRLYMETTNALLQKIKEAAISWELTKFFSPHGEKNTFVSANLWRLRVIDRQMRCLDDFDKTYF